MINFWMKGNRKGGGPVGYKYRYSLYYRFPISYCKCHTHMTIYLDTMWKAESKGESGLLVIESLTMVVDDNTSKLEEHYGLSIYVL